MRCLVLGANGFIGQHLVRRLLSEDFEVLTYGREDHFIGNILDRNKVLHIQGNFIDETRWDSILKGVDFCYHLISTTTPRSSNEAPIDDIEGNVIGSLRVLDAIKTFDTRLIFSSSGGTVYGSSSFDLINEEHITQPLCSYGISKLAIEKYLYLYRKLYDIESISLRIANPYGPGQHPNASQGAVAVFMGRILIGNTIDIWGDGSVIRDYIYIEDVIDALIAASSYCGQHRVFNIGSGSSTSLLELIREIELIVGKKAVVAFHRSRGFDVARNVLDISLAMKELSWRPKTSLSQGLKNTAKWLGYHY